MPESVRAGPGIETPDTSIFVEKRTSLEGLYAHFRTPHFVKFFASLGEVLARPPTGFVSRSAS
jgi:quinol monooxygenase YgiN